MGIKPGHELWKHHPHVRAAGELTFGERAADLMRNGFGSWAFVFCFSAFLTGWMVLNSEGLKKKSFDPYPFILLNLCLSCLAALQGALILIAAKRADRVAAEDATRHYQQTANINELASRINGLQDDQMQILAQLVHMNKELDLAREARDATSEEVDHGLGAECARRDEPGSRGGAGREADRDPV